MQFQVPQFIETEDKLVGVLTLRQFIYIAVAGVICLFLYFLLSGYAWLWFVLSALLVGASLAFGFIKVNGQPLERVFFAALGFWWQPQRYVWQPENPSLPKTEETMRAAVGGRFSVESILSGLALKGAWQQVQTGTQASAEKSRVAFQRMKERYEVFEKTSGERRAARRVDYR